MTTFLIQSWQFSLWINYLEDEPAQTEKMQCADEENCHIFSTKSTKFLSNSTDFLGLKKWQIHDVHGAQSMTTI